MINLDLLRELERDRTEDLCRWFFPNGRKVGNEWRIADTTGAPGNSLGIKLTVPNAGLWQDRATGEGGDFVKLLCANRNLTFSQAVEEIERAFGIALRSDFLPSRVSAPQSPDRNRSHKAAPWTGLPYHMTPQEICRAQKAIRALNGDAEAIQRIADWRELKPETIRSLTLDCALGIEGNKIAFLYETGMKLRPTGGSSNQSRWVFGKPFLWRGWPLIDPAVRDCVKEVWIVEGEFDCARLVEGKFGSDDLYEICVALGGANNFKPEWVNLFRGKTVFLWLDNDPAGHQATKRVGALLSQAGVKVRVVDWLRL
jgi:Toprim-like